MTNVDLQNGRDLIEASSDVVNICEVAEKILRHNRSIIFSKKNIVEYLICQCFRFMPTKIFDDDSHMLDQSPLFDHRRQVIKLILKKFLQVRLHYESEQFQNNVNRLRMRNNKLTLFQGQ